MLWLIIDAAILGLIIAVVEKDAFPGWPPMIGCALVVSVVTNAVAHFLPGWLALLGIVAGASAGGFLISWLCGMTWRRGFLAAGIYLGLRLALSLIAMALS